MHQEKLEELLNLFVKGEISRAEYEELIKYIGESPVEEDLNQAIDRVFQKMKNQDLLSKEEKALIYQNIIQDKRFESDFHQQSSLFPRTLWKQLGIAASILFIVSSGLYFYITRAEVQLVTAEAKVIDTAPSIISPGGNKAILTLSDGSKIILDHAKNGILADQAGVRIQKTSDGELLYTFSTTGSSLEKETKIIYNTIETPAGGKYQINLPDGSKVWLNASSTLRFPALFAGKTREVELTGEAFFDVAKNKTKPFVVVTKDQIVEVIGTQFNINSYSDEGNIKTTLIEGAVKIIYRDKVVLLGPGQQFQPVNSISKIVEADTEEVVAWKNGYFLFKNEDIRSIMRKVSRWYDVEISYEGEVPTVGFGGNISRSKDISAVLNALQLTNAVHFKVEGRRITVMP
jgi:ferric-dicitrate binding protein FerR (iron transport regulator)